MGKRWTWVAWSMLAVYIVSIVLATILVVANGPSNRTRPTRSCCLWASLPSWSSGP